jgi:hypothetical protein
MESVANLVIRYKTLFGNVRDCAQTGINTFRKTGEKMALIANMAHELAQDDGIVSDSYFLYLALKELMIDMMKIEKILKFCSPNQDARRDRHLRRYLLCGQETVSLCAAAIKDVKDDFNSWSESTENLCKALEETVGEYRISSLMVVYITELWQQIRRLRPQE